ncbi:MAG TPA: hypothetical protein DCR46_06880 [Cytophagales bacterium]|nr:hypothetical protein [Cytophagales bacterium]
MSHNLKLVFHIFSSLLFAGYVYAHDAPKAKPTKTQQHVFIENRGQWTTDILFRAEMPQGYILVTQNSILYQLVGYEPIKSNLPAGSHTNPHVSASQNKLKGHVIKINFPQSNPDFQVVGKKRVQTRFQYLKDKNPEKWVQGAMAFQEIDFQELYPGIDLKLYFHQGLLKYDFVVQPGYNPNQISLQYEGIERMSVKDNFLILPTCLGNVFEKPPFAYQIHENGKKQIDCQFSLKKNKVKFDLKNYDSSKVLVIDPELVFSTYSGSLADNWGNTATYDEEGNFYSGGIVFGNENFPVTPGPFGTYAGGDKDILIL